MLALLEGYAGAVGDDEGKPKPNTATKLKALKNKMQSRKRIGGKK